MPVRTFVFVLLRGIFLNIDWCGKGSEESACTYIGIVFYKLCRIIHVLGGGMMMTAGQDGATSFAVGQTGNEALILINTAPFFPSSDIAAAQGVFMFHSFNIFWIGLTSIIIAVTMNRKNSITGYWINAGMIGCVEIGLVLHLSISGISVMSGPWVGMTLFLFALMFTSIGKAARQPV